MELILRILISIGIGAICTFLIWVLSVKILPRLTRHSATSFGAFLLKSVAGLAVPVGMIVTLILIHKEFPPNPNLNTFYEGFLRLLVLVIAVRFLNGVSARFLQGVVRRASNDELQVMFQSLQPLINALVWIVGSLVYLQSLGMKMAAIWALLSAGGIGVGLALKDPAMELFAYLMILLDKPFRVGQFINIGDTWATIERIGVRSTRLRNVRGELVVMNNSSLTNGVISNFADMPTMPFFRMDRIGVTYDTSLELMEKVPAIISSVVNSTEHATFNRCHFVEFADSSLNFELVYYIDTRDYMVAMDAQQYINLGIMKLFDQNGIEFAFPTQTILVEGSPSESFVCIAIYLGILPVSYCQFRFLTGLAYLICIRQNEFANYSFTMKINDPRLSKTLMQITWIIGGIGFWNGFNALGAGNVESSTQWIAAWAVGGVGILSFVRHAVFHRSDALRMGWDLGARNDFQLEVGFANLAWGVVAIVGVLQGWGTEALGALVLLVGIYMLQAAVLHLLELKEAKQPRYASKFANSAYAICMLWFGIYAFSS